MKFSRRRNYSKTLCFPVCLFLLAAFGFATGAFAQSSYDLRSPDGRIEIRIRTAQSVRYDVLLKGQPLLENCALSLDVDHKTLGHEAKVIQSSSAA